MTTGFLFDIFNEQRAATVIDRVKSQSIKLRPYQAAAVDSAYAQWQDCRSTLINLATGLGKSICFAETMRRWDVAEQGKILLIAHRTELIFQAVGHAKRAGLTCGIEMAGRYAKGKEDVIVASVQSLNASQKCGICFGEGCDMCSNGKVKRFTRFNPRDFGLVTIDEAHHAVATGYRNVLTWFGSNPNQKTLLVTATPKRQDKVGMHNVCESVAYEMDLKSGIDEGWLVPIRQKFVTVEGLDISKVKTSKGDLQQGQLEQAFLGLDEDEERMLHSIVKPTLMEANGRKTIVFASGKEHANKLAACFNANGVEAGVVTDDTDLAIRAELVERYSNGDLQVLVNCMCFTEGFDAPKTAIIANCRPTKSEALYLQIIGRGTRPLAGIVDGPETAEERKAAIEASEKSHCVVLDFCGNSGEHKLVSVADVLAGDSVDPIDLAQAIAIAKEDGETVDTEELIEKVKQARKEAEDRKEQERIRRLMTSTKADHADYTAVDVNLFAGDKFDSQANQAEMASDGQKRFLKHLGIDKKQSRHLTRKQASGIIAQAYRKVQNDWRTAMNQATTQGELHQIGRVIKQRESTDYMLRDEKTIGILRTHYKQRRDELNGR
jgi:superfamily II DNA or RNA helicase